MTIAASIPKEIYDGNDVATNFSFSHKIWADSDLVVKHKTSADVVTTLVLDTDYTVNATYPDDGSGTATVTFDFPKVGSSYSTLATGEKLMCKRQLVRSRTSDLAGSYFFDALNADDDKRVAMIQEIYALLAQVPQATDFYETTMLTYEELLVLTGAALITTLDAKASIVDADILRLGDSADSFTEKTVLASVLWLYVNTFSSTESVKDNYGNELLKFLVADSAVNELTVQNASTGNGPRIGVTGNDTNIDLELIGKGTGSIKALSNIDANGKNITNVKSADFDIYDNGNSGVSKTIDWSNGSFQKLTLTADCTITFSNPTNGRLQLDIIQDGTGGWNVTSWASSPKWAGGSAPTITATATTGRDIITFYYDGTNYLGVPSQNFS